MSEPKPCPFCGSPAEVTIGPDGEEGSCTNLECRASEHFMPLDQWNRRAPDPRVAALVEATDELLEVADLRGDADLPHPANDDRLWTARMQDAWDSLRAALAAFKEEA